MSGRWGEYDGIAHHTRPNVPDPYAVRARTHRHDNCGRCQRCSKLWPCPKAGQTDPEPQRGRIVGAVLGAMAAVGLLCVLGGAWLLGWWRP